MSDKRVCFDFEVDFSNGGGIQGQGFRLDIPGEDISDPDLAAYIVEDMRLLMVGEVRILNKTIDKVAAQEQMANVRVLYNEDVAKFRQIADQISENTESYAAVYNEVAADNRGAGELQVKDYKKGRRSARVRRNKPRKQAGTAKGSLQASNRRNVDKLQDECLTNVRKRDECIEEIQQAEKGSDDLELDLS